MSLRLLVGLGNPGNTYQGHRHNFGFQCLDSIVKAADASWKNQHGAEYSQFNYLLNGIPTKVMALKPQQFMNRSGLACATVMRYYNIDPEDILVLYDELDLPLGKVRHRLGGGAGGHNGIRDILRHLEGDFHRLRLGIGHPGNKDRVQHYVLSDFSHQETPLVKDIIDHTVQYTDLLLQKNFAQFMNKMTELYV